MSEKKVGFGVAALVLGIIGMLTACIGIGIIFDILAIVFGLIAIISPKQQSGLGIAGLVIAICSIVTVIFVFVVFSSDSDKGQISSSNKESNIEVEKEDNKTTELSDSDFEITEYSYESTIGDSIYLLVVKNNSNETVDIYGDVTAFDESGNKLEIYSDEMFALEPGKSFPLKFYFDGKTPSSYEYKLSYSKSYTKSKLSSLSFFETVNDNNVIVDCTNNSDESIDFPKVFIIFFNGDNVVYSDYYYLNGNDMSLDPGETQSEEIECYGTFDRYESYYIAN